MRILMLETRRGTEDGKVVRQFRRGEIYDIADTLARAFLAAGFAVSLPPRRGNKRVAPSVRPLLRLIKK